jgi:hypothetical protein
MMKIQRNFENITQFSYRHFGVAKYTNIDETTNVIDDILRALAWALPFYADFGEVPWKLF